MHGEHGVAEKSARTIGCHWECSQAKDSSVEKARSTGGLSRYVSEPGQGISDNARVGDDEVKWKE
jgi:hypothetical protein